MNEHYSEAERAYLLEISKRALARLRTGTPQEHREQLANELITAWSDYDMGGISMEDLTNLATVKECIEEVYDCGNGELFRLFLQWLRVMNWINEYEHYKAMM